MQSTISADANTSYQKLANLLQIVPYAFEYVRRIYHHMDRSRWITWVLKSGLYSVHVTADTWREITLVSPITRK